MARESRQPASLYLFGVLLACGPFGGGLGDEPSRCGSVDALAIHEIQGRSQESPRHGERVGVTGVVTLLLPGSGFFIQSETADDDPLTSEGLFISGDGSSLEPGERVYARGVVIEQDGSTELTALELC